MRRAKTLVCSLHKYIFCNNFEYFFYILHFFTFSVEGDGGMCAPGKKSCWQSAASISEKSSPHSWESNMSGIKSN